MRNREIIEYLLYPRFFNAHSVLYKGTYCVSFSLHTLTKGKTTTHAYPFLVHNPAPLRHADLKEHPVLHADGNFSFLTHKFEIIYEEERKRIESQCVFRIEFDVSKHYQIFLTAKLLRKVTHSKAQEEVGLCVRKIVDTRYQTIDEQILEIKKDSVNNYQRVVFLSSEFFSSVDLYLCNFNYGYKYYRSKMQITNLVAGCDLSLHSPAARMREKCEAGERRGRSEDASYKAELLRDFQIALPTYYYELLKIIMEYGRLVAEYELLARQAVKEQNMAYLPQPNFVDLNYIKMNDKVTVKTLLQHYQASTPEEVLGHIFEQKELLRKHIRRVREEFCLILPMQGEKPFLEMINKQIEETAKAEVQSFVKYVGDLMPLQQAPQSEARASAIQQFTRSRCVWSNKIRTIPYFYIQGPLEERTSWRKQTTLTIFVHGYQGNSFDFQKAKNYLRRHNRHTHILIVESITKDMNQSIDCLGAQVAEEITKYIENCLFHFSLINFVGFSLGGLIARAAFAQLREYWPRFNLFATFSSPHLGISEGENNLVNIGVWYLIKVDKVKNLKELNFQSVKFNDSLLMRLSRCEGLRQFRKVVLVCSKNDGFVPYYSTVLDERKCDKQELKDLCRNITAQISQLDRVELVFDVENSGTFDKLTGRKGHIQFLDNDYFLDIFFRLYGPSM